MKLARGVPTDPIPERPSTHILVLFTIVTITGFSDKKI